MFNVYTNMCILVADFRCVFWNLTVTLFIVIKMLHFCPVYLPQTTSSTIVVGRALRFAPVRPSVCLSVRPFVTLYGIEFV